jgi:transcriptional regulator with XRE-family HTH domain
MKTDPRYLESQDAGDESVFAETEALRQEIASDEEYCYGYADSFMNPWVASQIRVLREQRGMTQKELGNAIGTQQAGISRLESINYSAWKTETLRKLARALRVRLRITFEPFGTLLDDAESFSPKRLQVVPRESDPRLLWPKRKGPVSDITPGSVLGRDLGALTDVREEIHARKY